jgi:hypothetical protein
MDNISCVRSSYVERQKGSTTKYSYIQLDPFAYERTRLLLKDGSQFCNISLRYIYIHYIANYTYVVL